MVQGWQNLSASVDTIFYFIVAVSVALLLGVTGTMLYFVFRYSRKRNPIPEGIKENFALEIIWTVIPTVLVLIIFWVGWKGFQYMRTVPSDAMLVKVSARMWSWSFTYENGKESNVLRLPIHKPIKLAITSADMLHSLSIPAFRVKEDAVPGMETHLWFLPDEVGSYDLFCTEYCGAGHSAMTTKVEVVPEKEFDAWYRSDNEHGKTDEAKPATTRREPSLSAGERLIQVKGCIACHTTDGTPKIGPTFKGSFGKKEIVLRDGKELEITVDEAFIKQTLLQPELDRVKGFPPIMPSQKGLLTDTEIGEIVEYIKTIK